jgi:PTS system ascorbate-specific IIA component
MIGILVIAHGSLGESLLQCASHVMGGLPPQLRQMGIGMHGDPAALLPAARELVKELDQEIGRAHV